MTDKTEPTGAPERPVRVEGDVMRRPEWRYVQGYVSETRYHRVYRDDYMGVQLEVITRRKDGMPRGKGKMYFFEDGNDYEFRTEDALLEAWSAREANRKRLKERTKAHNK